MFENTKRISREEMMDTQRNVVVYVFAAAEKCNTQLGFCCIPRKTVKIA
jgi:hypothetical protein